MTQEIHNVVIIGAGPAGLAAAMQLSRQGQQPLVLERSRVGGLLWNANLVENYPGFSRGISGPDLVALFQDQAKHLGVRIAFEEARLKGFEGGYFRIDTNKRSLAARVVVAATGTKARKLPKALVGRGAEGLVFSEVYPLLDCSDKKVIIIGGGDAAFDYALNLAKRNQVVVLNRGKGIRALPLLFNRAREHPAISYWPAAEVIDLALDQSGRLRLEVDYQGEIVDLDGDYLIAAIGREPDHGFAPPVIMKEINTPQSEPVLHMIGDLRNGDFRQTAIAAGDGIRAAMEIGQYLSKETL